MDMKTDNSKKESFKLEKLLPCYLYISASDSVLDERIESVKSHLRGKINFDTDFKVFNGTEEIDEEEFTNYVNTPSLFSPKKIMVIKHMEKVPADLQKRVKNLITGTPGNSGNIVFFITASTQKLNTALMDSIKSAGKIAQLKAPLSGTLKKWLDEKSESDGIRFTEKAALLLIENVNTDFNLLKRQYDKLFDYIISEEKKVIDENTVRSLVNRIYSLKIFDLVDYIGKRDKDGSIKALKSMLDEGHNLIGLVTLVHRMFKCFLYIKSGDSKSLVTDYIESSMKVPPYFIGSLVNKYIRLSDNYNETEIFKIFKILNKYDIGFRTNSSLDEQLAKKLILEIIDIN